MNWENGIKSPLFIRYPGIIPEITKVHTQIEDLFPTILEITGIEKPNSLQLDGLSLVPVLKGKSIDERPLFTAFPNPKGEMKTTNDLDPDGNYYPITKEYKSGFDAFEQRIAIRKGPYKYIINEGDEKTALFNIDNDHREKENEIADLNEIAKSLSFELNDWYKQILNLPGSYTMPEFQIGYNNRTFNQIYACSPCQISDSLVNMDHYLGNWKSINDYADYNINVISAGEYEVFLIHQIEDYSKLTFKLIAGSGNVKGRLTDFGDRDFGTLLENESAYWYDYLKNHSFKKEILKSKIGIITLDKGQQKLTVKLDSIDKGFNGKLSQLIAIHLIRKSN